MKKTAIDYFNFFLTGVLVLLVILYVTALLKNKEFDKIRWTAKIVSRDKDAASEKSNMIKIVDAVFFNTSNNSKNTLHPDAETLIFSKGYDSAYFWTEHNLLPDSVSLKYFSVDDNIFYKLNAKLSQESFKKSLKNNTFQTVVSIEIYPQGKLSLSLQQPDNDDFKSISIQNFQAEKTEGNVDLLVYRKSLGEKYNEFPTITTVSEFSELLKNKYLWAVNVEAENGGNITEISANSFDGKIIEIDDEVFNKAEVRNIPKSFLIKWRNKQQYSSEFNFDAQEILTAFKELDGIKKSEPVLFTFKIFKNSYPQCEISKGGKIISLKNLYPDVPIKYAD